MIARQVALRHRRVRKHFFLTQSAQSSDTEFTEENTLILFGMRARSHQARPNTMWPPAASVSELCDLCDPCLGPSAFETKGLELDCIRQDETPRRLLQPPGVAPVFDRRLAS